MECLCVGSLPEWTGLAFKTTEVIYWGEHSTACKGQRSKWGTLHEVHCPLNDSESSTCLLMSAESCVTLFLGPAFGIIHAKHSCVLYVHSLTECVYNTATYWIVKSHIKSPQPFIILLYLHSALKYFKQIQQGTSGILHFALCNVFMQYL